jgi:signal transduction histidine kinase
LLGLIQAADLRNPLTSILLCTRLLCERVPIAPDIQRRLSLSFVRGADRTDKSSFGLGLGLIWWLKSRAHGGRMVVDANRQYTIFVFWINFTSPAAP